ncbi:hypothetical protein [Micromonospora sp. WMMD1082]|uniref:hypothetical protein n=1 Tax=Micromonospora sp. WMMD1082 TaxID=3016104 RepID=UPI002415ADD4|nr:hypothetical protein [Micromonospora sp. WMMD1082]MDG4796179.1 hypothetical protein [Micromonospora sp. WMMD1082]
MSAWMAILGAGFLVSAAIFGHALITAPRVAEPTAPDPAPDFDAHASTALAVLAPDDPALPDDDVTVINAAIAATIDNFASYLTALRLGLDPQTCELLREQLHTQLLADLTPAQMAVALVIGLQPHAAERAAHLTDLDRLSTADLES